MSKFKQLHMRRTGLSDLEPPVLDEGQAIHSHRPGDEEAWERIMLSSFASPFSFTKTLIPLGGYAPEYVLYLTENGKEIATAMGTERPEFAGEGWFRMVGTLAEARGRGAGRKVCLAVMHDLAQRGYNSIVLSTDDHRLPAIAMYLSLGFSPVLFDDEHRARWDAVMAQLAAYKKEKEAKK